MWSKVVFHGTCVICFAHSIAKPPFHVLGSHSFYELCCRHYLPLTGKAENAIYWVLFPHTLFGSLVAGVLAHNLDSRDNYLRVTEKAHPQDVFLVGAVAAEIEFLGQQ